MTEKEFNWLTKRTQLAQNLRDGLGLEWRNHRDTNPSWEPVPQETNLNDWLDAKVEIRIRPKLREFWIFEYPSGGTRVSRSDPHECGWIHTEEVP